MINEFVKIWLYNDILFMEYRPCIIIDLNAAKQIVSSRLQLQKESSYPVFCDTRGIFSSNKAGRDYLAKEGSALIKAVAAFDNRFVGQAVLKFYLRNSKPLAPTAIFSEKTKALEYLQPFSKI